jgi:polyferredoxin
MSTPKPRWSIWKKLLVIPLWFAIGVEVLCVWIFIDETASPRIADGQVDDSPRDASLILGFLVAVLYLGYAALVAFIRFLVTPTRS